MIKVRVLEDVVALIMVQDRMVRHRGCLPLSPPATLPPPLHWQAIEEKIIQRDSKEAVDETHTKVIM